MWSEPDGNFCPPSNLGVKNACYLTSNPSVFFMAVVKEGCYFYI